MAAAGVVLYRESFARRTAGMVRPGWPMLDGPGLCGVYGAADHPGGRVLITDDEAAPVLEALMPNFYPQIVNVFSAAHRCRALITAAGRWDDEPATAMLCRDLRTVPDLPAPADLTIHRVRRVPADAEGGVPLEKAAQACLRADPNTTHIPLPGFLAFLRSLPATTRLLAAVDSHGAVRATAGCSTFDGDASAYFVSTDSQWAGRGVATAMTATVLRWANEAGAHRASLDASPAGLSIYSRLGFEPVSSTNLFASFR